MTQDLFKVFEKRQGYYLDDDVYLGQDGLLYEEEDTGLILLIPSDIHYKRAIKGEEYYNWSQKKYDEYCVEHQSDWYMLVPDIRGTCAG